MSLYMICNTPKTLNVRIKEDPITDNTQYVEHIFLGLTNIML